MQREVLAAEALFVRAQLMLFQFKSVQHLVKTITTPFPLDHHHHNNNNPQRDNSDHANDNTNDYDQHHPRLMAVAADLVTAVVHFNHADSLALLCLLHFSTVHNFAWTDVRQLAVDSISSAPPGGQRKCWCW